MKYCDTHPSTQAHLGSILASVRGLETLLELSCVSCCGDFVRPLLSMYSIDGTPVPSSRVKWGSRVGTASRETNFTKTDRIVPPGALHTVPFES